MQPILDASPSALAHGTVAWSRGSKFVVWRRLADDRAEAFPLVQAGEPRTRSELPVGHTDLVDMGVPCKQSFVGCWVIRVDGLTKIKGGIKIGTCPPTVLAEIRRAVRHLDETQRIEAAYPPGRARR